MDFTVRCIALAAMMLTAGPHIRTNAEQDDLSAAVARSYPSAAIVRQQDVDAVACAPLGDSPGLVRADLNNDGRHDYGVLLRLKFTGKERVWQGKPFKEAEFAF